MSLDPQAALPPPGAIHDLAERAVEYVRRALGLVLDYTPETLPVLDHYLTTVPAEQAETVALIGAAAGAYFGEVARKLLGGEWDQTDASADEWDLVVADGIRITPAALAGEAILRTDTGTAGYDVPDDCRGAVEDALDAKGAVPEDEYYSLSGRLETMQLIADAIAAARLVMRST
jgi:hypothetical protein